MLQHRQVYISAEIGAVCGENLIISDQNEVVDEGGDRYTALNVFEASSGCLINTLPSCKIRRNLRVISTAKHWIKYDYLCGQFAIDDRTTGQQIGRFRKNVPANMHIACTCASELLDGMVFYAYNLSNGVEENFSNLSRLHAVNAFIIGEESAGYPLTFVTSYKGSGFADRPHGRIVSMHCHPTKQILFIVYAQGVVQVWSYAKCFLHLQMQLLKGSGQGSMGMGDAAGEGWGDGTNDRDDNDALSDDDREGLEGGDAEGSVVGSSRGRASTLGRSSTHGGVNPFASTHCGVNPYASTHGGTNPYASTHGGVNPYASTHGGSLYSSSHGGIPLGGKERSRFLGGSSAKQQQMQLLQGVAYFMLPTATQLTRLDPDFASVTFLPSSFRVDSHGRFAAVVWNERLVCVYDVFPLMGVNLLEHALTPTNATQLNIFGAFPCRSLSNPAECVYSFGPLCFHPSAQVLLLTVLRHKMVPNISLPSCSRIAASTGEHVRIPLSPLIYAISLRVHQPILSAIGSYEVGADVNVSNLGSSSISALPMVSSINWRPRALDCTLHSGLLVVTFGVSFVGRAVDALFPGGGTAVLDEAPPVEDVGTVAPSVSWNAEQTTQDQTDVAVILRGAQVAPDSEVDNRGAPAARKSTHIMMVYGLCPAWLQGMGLQFLTAPLFSQLPVPPDTYIYGEGAMSSTAVFTHRPAAEAPVVALLSGGAPSPSRPALAVARSFALIDRPTAASGDGSGSSGQISDYYPLLLTLRPALEDCEDENILNSLGVFYHIFRTHWVFPSFRSSTDGHSTTEGSTATYMGKLPAQLKDTDIETCAKQAAAWLSLPAEHCLQLSGWDAEAEAQYSDAHVAHTFYPSELVTRESIGFSSVTPSADSWDALLVGMVQRSVSSTHTHHCAESSEINASAATLVRRCVCFLRYGQSEEAAGAVLSSAYSSFRDAAYWAKSGKETVSAATVAVPVDTATAMGILALTQSGRKLVHLSCSESNSLALEATWDLGAEMSAVWTAPAGSPDVVVLATQVPESDVNQCLFATPPNPTAADFAAVGSAMTSSNKDRLAAVLVLRPKERILQFLWQTMPSSLGSGQDRCAGLNSAIAAQLRQLQQVWLLETGAPLLALRTTQRVLICTGQLRILSQFTYVDGPQHSQAKVSGTDSLLADFMRRLGSPSLQISGSSRASSFVTQDPAMGMTWVGAALCFTCESGAVQYLLPGPSCGAVGDSSTHSSILSRALGFRAPVFPGSRHSNLRRSAHRGSIDSGSAVKGLFFTLPRNTSITIPGSQRLLAVLSDRVLLSYVRRDDGRFGVTSLPLVAFTQRPVNPMEPLILGMLALEYLRPPLTASLGQYRMDATAWLLTTYMSPSQDSMSGGSVGAKPSAQASHRLVLALSQFQPAAMIGAADNLTDTISTLSVVEASPTPAQTAGTLAAWCSGVRFQHAQVATAGEFPAVRWVPTGVKYAVAAQGRLYKLASLELLRSRTELQEMLLDSETYGGTALPHPQRPLATQLTSAAIWFFIQTSTDASKDERAVINSATAAAFKDLCEQQKALTRRLLDIAGDYASLCAVLFKEGASVGKLIDEEVYNSDRSAYMRVASNLQHLQDAGFAKDLSVPSVAQLLQFALQGQLSVSALGGSMRRKGLTHASSSTVVPDVTNTSTFQLIALEKQQKDHATRACQQQGPIPVALSAGAFASELSKAPGALPVMGPRCMGLLAMDLLEDFMGINMQLEINSVSAEDLNGGNAGDAALGGAGDAVDAASGIVGGIYMGRTLPETWVEGVGMGAKEHELLSGYWRFSDVAYATEDGFCCSSLSPSGTRLVFLDLSRFDGPGLELYCTAKEAMKVEYSTSAVDPGEKHENVKSLCDVVYSSDQGSQGQRGLRCLVPRGSQLDVGIYHADPHRSKLTLELMVCFDDSKCAAASGPHVLLQRRVFCEDETNGTSSQQTALWTLSVDRTGAVCFAFGEEWDQGAVLRSPAGSLALTQTTDTPGGGWAHVALIMDSSKTPAAINSESFSQSAILVTLVVKGEPTEMKIAPRTIPVDALTSTVLLVGPNLGTGWRLTELRAWADLRGLADLESQRDNFLVMAMKRKRLQLRVKGTKKLFTAYREVEIPAEASQATKFPSQSKDGDNDITANTQSPTVAIDASSRFAQPSKVLGTKTLLGTPSALLAPKTEQAVDIATTTAVAASAPVAMSARERRLQQLKGAIAGPKPTSKPSALAPPSPVRSALAVEAAPASSPVRASPGKALVSPSSEDPAAVKTRRVNFASFGGIEASEGLAKPPIKPAQGIATSATSDCFIRLGSLPELGLLPNKAEYQPYSTAKPMTYPVCWLECRTAVAGAVLTEASSPGLQSVLLTGGSNPFAALSVDLLRSAESVVVAPAIGPPSAGFRVALLANRSLLVYETSAQTSAGSPAHLVAKMSMGAVKLAQWAFISPDMVLLVSNTAGFTIRVTPPPGTTAKTADVPFAPKPVKIFDRCDLKDLNSRSDDRWVYDLQVCADGWTLLTTGPRDRQEGDGSNSTVSLYHSRSAQSISFKAAGGCFRSGLQQVLLVYQHSPEESGTVRDGATWSVTAINFSDLHAYWKGATVAANKQWKEPLSLYDCAVWQQWSLTLPDSNTVPAGAQLNDWVGAACLDLASEPAQPTLRVVSAIAGQVLAVPLKIFSKALSTHTPFLQQETRPGSSKTLYRQLVAPTAPVHIWSIGKLLYVLTRTGELHQCNVGAAEPQYIGNATLPLFSSN